MPAEYRDQPGSTLRVIDHEEFAQQAAKVGLVMTEHTQHGFFWLMWWALFFGCKVELYDLAYQVLHHWSADWQALRDMLQGQQLKQQLDKFIPIRQIILARKPRVPYFRGEWRTGHTEGRLPSRLSQIEPVHLSRRSPPDPRPDTADHPTGR